MMLKIWSFLACLAYITASPLFGKAWSINNSNLRIHGHKAPVKPGLLNLLAGHKTYAHAYPKYTFEYAVKDLKTGDIKSQKEWREGDVVKGGYSLVEPDGSIRTVNYVATKKDGFNAVVKRTKNLHHHY